MQSPEIRRVRDDELPAFLDTLSTAFLERFPIDKLADELRPIWDLDRAWGAFDGGRVLGTFRSWSTELTLPGGAVLPAAAVAAVTVLPTHRRRGILRGMVRAAHDAMRELGDALGLLHAAEWPIYGRFGYGPGCQSVNWTLDALGTAFMGESVRGVDLVTPGEASRDAIRTVFDAWRARQPGEIRRREVTWQYELGLTPSVWGPDWKGFLALRRDAAGEVDGYARYRAKETWEHGRPRSTIELDELHALSDEAYGALWRFLAETDLVSTVTAERRRIDERLPWLLDDARAARITSVGDGLWVRLLDAPRALASRTYEREADLVLELVDDEAPGGRMRLELAAGPAGATCRPTNRSPDLTLAIGAIGAAYLGGTRLAHAVLAAGVDEHRQGALAAADALFRTASPPWCSTFF